MSNRRPFALPEATLHIWLAHPDGRPVLDSAKNPVPADPSFSCLAAITINTSHSTEPRDAYLDHHEILAHLSTGWSLEISRPAMAYHLHDRWRAPQLSVNQLYTAVICWHDSDTRHFLRAEFSFATPTEESLSPAENLVINHPTKLSSPYGVFSTGTIELPSTQPTTTGLITLHYNNLAHAPVDVFAYDFDTHTFIPLADDVYGDDLTGSHIRTTAAAGLLRFLLPDAPPSEPLNFVEAIAIDASDPAGGEITLEGTIFTTGGHRLETPDTPTVRFTFLGRTVIEFDAAGNLATDFFAETAEPYTKSDFTYANPHFFLQAPDPATEFALVASAI